MATIQLKGIIQINATSVLKLALFSVAQLKHSLAYFKVLEYEKIHPSIKQLQLEM